MNSWLPVVAGYGTIAVVILLVIAFPNTWWAQELRRAYEVQRSGPLGRYTARDQFRSAGVSLLVAVLLVALSYGAYSISLRFHVNTAPDMVGEVYGFTLFLLAAVAVASSIQSLARALRWARAEGREARVAGKHTRELAAVHEVLQRYDPAQVAEFEDPVEYDFQARRLLAILTRAQSYEELVAAVHLQFAVWFGKRAGPSHRYDPLCHELWQIWSRRDLNGREHR